MNYNHTRINHLRSIHWEHGPQMQTVAAIEQIPGVQGGYPVIAGTRTPVRTIIEMFCETHMGNIDAIVGSLPHLTRQQVEAALDYYQQRPDLVDEDITRQRRALFDHLRS